MLVLATEKNAQGIRRLAHVTDGDAYYWSSVNPDTNDRHETKLREMAATAHAAHGYWMAPFAPGFDARSVGGTKSVPRDGGRTLRTEYAAAMASGPDVLGLISWNEFSENSHVEPSVRQGSQSLDVLRELRGLPASATPSAPSSSAARHDPLDYWPGLLRITGCAVLLVAAVAALAWLRGIRMRKAGRT